ncbi:MAG: XRE family transcriptional regulator [Anaerovorax sp.]|nr:XRE family transcriptional regulator [Anaerovorax sp.]
MKDITIQIGNNIKQIRKSRGLTIEDLALQSGVSKSMISEIERGMRNSSITVLWNIANTLKIPLNYLLKSNNSETATIYKKSEISTMEGNGFLFQSLMNFDEDKKFEIYLTEYHPNTQTEASTHYTGVEEYALIITGSLCLNINDIKYEAGEGDVIHFSGDKLHYYSNETNSPTKAFILMFYPDNNH